MSANNVDKADLNISNFFSEYILDPSSDKLTPTDRAIAWIATIALGVVTLGIAQLTAYALRGRASPEAPAGSNKSSKVYDNTLKGNKPAFTPEASDNKQNKSSSVTSSSLSSNSSSSLPTLSSEEQFSKWKRESEQQELKRQEELKQSSDSSSSSLVSSVSSSSVESVRLEPGQIAYDLLEKIFFGCSNEYLEFLQRVAIDSSGKQPKPLKELVEDEKNFPNNPGLIAEYYKVKDARYSLKSEQLKQYESNSKLFVDDIRNTSAVLNTLAKTLRGEGEFVFDVSLSAQPVRFWFANEKGVCQIRCEAKGLYEGAAGVPFEEYMKRRQQ